jgi:hypothetical protein
MNGDQADVYMRMAEAAAREIHSAVVPKPSKRVKLLGGWLRGAKEWGPLFLRCTQEDTIDWTTVEHKLRTAATQRIEAVLAGASEDAAPETEEEAEN